MAPSRKSQAGSEEEELAWSELNVAGELWRPGIAAPLPSYASSRLHLSQDDALQKARAERLSQLLNVALRYAGDVAEADTEQLDGLLCGGNLGDATVLRSMMRHLGLDCRREPTLKATMKRRLRELITRRDAASQLIDEMEREVLVLSNQLALQASELTKSGTPQLQILDKDAAPEAQPSCFTDLLSYGASPCAASRMSRMSRMEVLERPSLRCELRQKVKEAEEELSNLRTEVANARKVGASAWENVKQVLLDSQPEANLLDGRRSLLAFARGKARGTSIATKLLDWDVRRKLLQAAVFGWRTQVLTRRRTDRMQVLLQIRMQSDAVEVCFTLWRQAVDKQWSRLAERRISRSEEIMIRLSLRFLAGNTEELLRWTFTEWRLGMSGQAGTRRKGPRKPPREEEGRKKCCCVLM